MGLAWRGLPPSPRSAPEILLVPALVMVAVADLAYSALWIAGSTTWPGVLGWVLVTLLVFPTQIAVVFGRQRDREMGLRREVESQARRLAEEHRTLLAVLAATPAGILVVDREDRVGLISPGATSEFGLEDPEAWKGRPGREVLQEWAGCLAKREGLDRALAEVERDADARIEGLGLQTAGPGSRELELFSAPVLSEGGVRLGRIWVCFDVTAQKALDRQLVQAQKLESLTALTGGVAHDFNNLLMAILGSADLTLDELPASSPHRESLTVIREAGRTAAALCRQMLIYAGRERFSLGELDLSRAVEEIRQLIRSSVPRKAALEFDLADGLPAIEADAAQVRQVVLNLVSNASEALGEESGSIRISTGATTCDPDPRGGWPSEELSGAPGVFLEVADTGCGMDEETQARMFDPFFSTKFTGRGLGLAGVLGIVRGHGGEVRVRSEPGRGTRIRVLFPALERTGEPSRAEGEKATRWRGSGTVLLVDDEELVRRVAARMLEHLGFGVLTAADGREAIRLFRQRRGEILFVLLDLTMPEMSGEEVLRELRRIDPQVRVVIASGYPEEEVARRFAGGELPPIVHKPYRMRELRRHGSRMLRD